MEEDEAMREMKRAAVLMAVVILTGCGSGTAASTRVEQENKVQSAIDEQIAAADAGSTEADSSAAEELNPTPESVAERQKTETASADGIDYDLLDMDADMVYATVYQMMLNPSDYIGKKVRIRGTYYVANSEKTKKNYFYCIISDALGCCQNGMEFVWDDGSHVYPDEYPEEMSEITVTGTFDVYTEEGDEMQNIRLKDASISL